jgi:hypothetical protein
LPESKTAGIAEMDDTINDTVNGTVDTVKQRLAKVIAML